MNQGNSLLNELRRALCYLVLILNNATLVGIQQAVENIVGTLDICVRASDAHQCTFLVYLAAGHFVEQNNCRIFLADALHGDGLVSKFLKKLLIWRCYEITKWRLYSFAPLNLCREVRLLHRYSVFHICDSTASIAFKGKLEARRDSELGNEVNGERTIVVERHITQAGTHAVHYVKLKVLGNLLGKLEGVQDIHLVLDT